MKHHLCLALTLSLSVAGGVAADELTPMEELGKLLFFDENLSTPPGQSCATCHGPEVGFAGPVSEINLATGVYPGAIHTRFGNRKPPTAAYASFSPDFYYDEEESLFVGGMFWDGRALNVVEQAKGPFLNPVEQNNPHMKTVIRKIRLSDYAGLFEEVFGAGSLYDVETAYHQMATAIGAYEGSFEVNRFSSKYDYYLAGQGELTEQELRGLVLFEGQGNCAACHPSQPGPGGEPPLFTDYTYDNLGVPKNPDNPFYDMPPHFNPEGEDFIDYGLGAIVGLDSEMGKVKVPTLRNVGNKPFPEFVQAYMHNGVFKDLRTVVDFYNTRDLGGWPPPEVPENVNTDELGDLGLTDQDVDDIVAFMNTLSDGYELDGRTQHAADFGTESTGGLQLATRADGALQFSMETPGRVSLRVYDVGGRTVRTALSGAPYPAGRHTWQWDGRDDAGRMLGSGVYLYAVHAGGRSATHRTLILR